MEDDTHISGVAAKAVAEHQYHLAQYIEDNLPDGIGKTRVMSQLAVLTLEIGQLFQAHGVKPYPLTPEGQALVTRTNEEVDKEFEDGREG